MTLTFTENGGRPGDQRGFLHKKLLGGVSKLAGFLPGPAGVIVSKLTGRLAGRAQQKAVATQLKFAPDLAPSGFGSAGRLAGRALHRLKRGHAPGEVHISHTTGLPITGPTGGGPCDFPKVRDAAGICRTPTSGEFGGPQFEVGEAVMGQYGAALEPGSRIIDRAICLRGMQLGNDGLCYNKSQITNKQRMWPAGRKPLLSGGDMRAIGVAARAGRRLEGATKRLQRLGMMKKPTSRRALPPHRHARAATDVVSV